MKGDLAKLKGDGIRTCTKHFIKVDKDGKNAGICPTCLPNLDLYVDQAYVNSRNALIPEAMSIAKEKLMPKKNKEETRHGKEGRLFNHCFLTEYFCDAMTKLVNEHELRG